MRGGQRIQELDLLRGFAIVLMITGHSILVHPIDYTSIVWCQYLHNWIYSFHMELFFVVSGAVYHCSKYRSYLLDKSDRLLIPMLFVGLISLLFINIGGDLVHKHIPLTEGLKGILTGKTYWFLYTLFIIFLFYPLIDRMNKKSRWFELALFFTLIVVGHFIDYPSAFRISSVMYYLPYFMFGHIISDGLRENKYEMPVKWQIAAIVVCTALYVALLPASKTLLLVRYMRAFTMIVAFYYLARLFVVLERKSTSNNVLSTIKVFLCLASKYSLQLYLFNGFVLVVARTLLISVLHITNPVLVIPIIVVANMAVTLPLCKYVLEKTRWIGWLCGVKYRPWRKI